MDIVEEEIQLFTMLIDKGYDFDSKSNSYLSITKLLDNYSIKSISFISELASKETTKVSYESKICSIVSDIHNMNKGN